MAQLTARAGQLPPSHLVADILAPQLRAVFCGTAMGYRSARDQAYYANPGNYFWRTLHRTGLTPHQLAPQHYAEVLRYGIGLTDLCKAHYGQDVDLPADAFDAAALRAKVQHYQPQVLAFTSKTAAAAYLRTPSRLLAYGLQEPSIGRTRLYVLPSPSGQARPHWVETPWQQLADALRIPSNENAPAIRG